MIKVKQYRPAFFEGFKNEEHEVKLISDILELDFVKNFATDPNFHRFSYSPDFIPYIDPQGHLMCEMNGGTKWYVVATIYADHDLVMAYLPKWEPKKG